MSFLFWDLHHSSVAMQGRIFSSEEKLKSSFLAGGWTLQNWLSKVTAYNSMFKTYIYQLNIDSWTFNTSYKEIRVQCTVFVGKFSWQRFELKRRRIDGEKDFQSPETATKIQSSLQLIRKVSLENRQMHYTMHPYHSVAAFPRYSQSNSLVYYMGSTLSPKKIHFQNSNSEILWKFRDIW